MKNRKLLLIVSLVLALTMSLGGTLAYLTDTDGDVNVMVVGNVQIVQNEQQRVDQTVTNSELEPFEQKQAMLPVVGATGEKLAQTINGYELKMRDGNKVKNYIDKIVTVTNTGASDAYVRTLIAIPEAGDFNTTYNASSQWFHWNGVSDTDTTPGNGWIWGRDMETDWPANTDNWDVLENVNIGGKVYDVYVATNKNAIASKETTAPTLLGIFLDKAVDCEVLDDGTLNYTFKDETGKVWNLGDITNLEVRVLSQAVQASGFKDAWTALDTAFGDVTPANVQAWMTDIEVGSPGEKNETNNPPEFLPEGNWIDEADTSWYSDDATSYEISTAAQLAGLAKLVNEHTTNDRFLANKTVTLTKDIDLEGKYWTPIGSPGHAFYGIFDGGAHTISNLYVDAPTQEGAGLFGAIFFSADWAKRAAVENVTIDNATVKAKENAAAVVGHSYGNVNNCTVKNATISVAEGKAGAIVGTTAVDSAHISISGNKVENITIINAEGNNECGAIAGRVWQNRCTLEDNTFSTVTVNGTVLDKEVGDLN